MKEFELPWTEIKGATTKGKNRGLMARIWREMDKQNPEMYVQLHCISHQHSLCGKNLKSEHIIEVQLSVVNFIHSDRFNHASFNLFVANSC
jgi:hypothetical protein